MLTGIYSKMYNKKEELMMLSNTLLKPDLENFSILGTTPKELWGTVATSERQSFLCKLHGPWETEETEDSISGKTGVTRAEVASVQEECFCMPFVCLFCSFVNWWQAPRPSKWYWLILILILGRIWPFYFMFLVNDFSTLWLDCNSSLQPLSMSWTAY